MSYPTRATGKLNIANLTDCRHTHSFIIPKTTQAIGPSLIVATTLASRLLRTCNLHMHASVQLALFENPLCPSSPLHVITIVASGTMLALASPPPFVTNRGGGGGGGRDNDDVGCPVCRRRYESFGPKRKIIEGGCGHARCFECCCRDDGGASPAGCSTCRERPPLSGTGGGKHGGGYGGGRGGGRSIGSSAGSVVSAGGGGAHYFGGGRESGFQSYAASIASGSSRASGDSFAGHRDYAGIRARVSSPRPPSVISLLSRFTVNL